MTSFYIPQTYATKHIENDAYINCTAKSVASKLLVLSAKGKRAVYLYDEMLADSIGKSHRQAQRYMRLLEDAGYIDRHTYYDKKTNRRKRYITVNPTPKITPFRIRAGRQKTNSKIISYMAGTTFLSSTERHFCRRQDGQKCRNIMKPFNTNKKATPPIPPLRSIELAIDGSDRQLVVALFSSKNSFSSSPEKIIPTQKASEECKSLVDDKSSSANSVKSTPTPNTLTVRPQKDQPDPKHTEPKETPTDAKEISPAKSTSSFRHASSIAKNYPMQNASHTPPPKPTYPETSNITTNTSETSPESTQKQNTPPPDPHRHLPALNDLVQKELISTQKCKYLLKIYSDAEILQAIEYTNIQKENDAIKKTYEATLVWACSCKPKFNSKDDKKNSYKYLDQLRKFDGRTLKHYTVCVGKNYIEFSWQHLCHKFSADEDNFIKNVQEFYAKNLR